MVVETNSLCVFSILMFGREAVIPDAFLFPLNSKSPVSTYLFFRGTISYNIYPANEFLSHNGASIDFFPGQQHDLCVMG